MANPKGLSLWSNGGWMVIPLAARGPESDEDSRRSCHRLTNSYHQGSSFPVPECASCLGVPVQVWEDVA